MQTQTSNTLHNAIMEAGGKDLSPKLALGNYIQWKSIIKRYIDTKPNHELIHYCLKNPPYKFKWADKEVPISEGSSVTKTETYMENYKNVLQDIRDQLNAKAEASQELKTVSYHKLYDIMKQHPNEVNEIRAERIACTANPLALVAQQQPVYHPQNHPTHYTQNSSTRSQQAATKNSGKAIVNSPLPIYDQEPSMVAEDVEMLKDNEIDKLMDLFSLSFKKIYKPTNNNLRTSSNTSRENQDNSPRINRGAGYDNQRLGNVAGARETVGSIVVQKSRIQCYNCKEFGHVARECQKPKRVKDAAYHREKLHLCKQEEAGIQLNVEQVDWRDDTDDESEDQKLEAHYMYMAQIQEVSPDAVDSGPIFNSEPVQKVSTDDHYNVFAIDSEHPEQSESNDDDDDLANERKLLSSLIEKLKCEIDDSKNRNQFLETSNKVLVEQLKEIVLFIIDSGCSKHMTGNLKLLINFVEKFLGTVKFGNDQIAPILGYGDLGNNLLTGSRGTDLYSITLQNITSPNPICLMAKAATSQAWLWHRCLSHLNFDTINLLSKNDIVIGLPKLKFIKDHLCSSCELGKAKRKSFQTKITPISKRGLQLLHMDLCGSMRVASINGKNMFSLVQRGLHAKVRIVQTDKGTKFLNKTLHAYFASEGNLHQTSVARTPEQNCVVKR
nr:hypothetical protein [Tanacetum cinerariifolium]